MKATNILGKSIEKWKEEYPLLREMIETNKVFWINPTHHSFDAMTKVPSLSEGDVKEASDRLTRFAPYISRVFPETKKMNGIIESPIIRIPKMQESIEKLYNQNILVQLLLKCDNALPIAGSIKARGGIYEVLKHAEDLAIKNGMLNINDDYSILAEDKFKNFFSKYSIAVGSTGNLGLSIGIMSAKLGFKVTVHMSSDAKEWKKNLLRSKGVNVIEYDSDYTKAVEEGRKLSDSDPKSHFVDDENSVDLFLGYSVAAYRLNNQLESMNIIVDERHPLFVYLPCGVGGGPGGVAFGLKLIYGDNVHCFFAEPTHSPCMLLGMMTELHDRVSVQDFGIDNITEADGLAVGKASGFVGKTMEELLSGIYTVDDNQLYILLSKLIDTENIYLEPSALAGLEGPIRLFNEKSALDYIAKNNLQGKMNNAIHIAWATGGSLVPEEIMKEYYKKGSKLLSSLNNNIYP